MISKACPWLRMMPWMLGLGAIAVAYGTASIYRPGLSFWLAELDSTSALQRSFAMSELRDGDFPPEAVVEAAVRGLSDRAEPVRKEASLTIRAVAPEVPELIAIMISNPQASYAQREAAVHASQALGHELLEHLIGRLPDVSAADDDPVFRTLAARARPATHALQSRLQHPRADRRARSARALAALGASASRFNAKIAAGLSDPDETVRYWCARTLGRTIRHGPEVRRAIEAATRDESAAVREAATAALVRNLVEDIANLGPTESETSRVRLQELGKDAVPPLIDVLDHPQVSVAAKAAQFLLAADVDLGIEEISMRIRDADDEYRRTLSKRIVAVGPPAVAPLAAAIEDPYRKGRAHLVRILADLGAEAGPALPVLERMLTDPAVSVRLWAVMALARIGEPAIRLLPQMRKAIEGPLESNDRLVEAVERLEAMQSR